MGRTRPLAIAFVFVAQVLALVGLAYLVVQRGNLPAFFPHALAADRDDATDAPMAVICLAAALVALYASRYARRHRSWLRSRNWHRKHGRV